MLAPAQDVLDDGRDRGGLPLWASGVTAPDPHFETIHADGLGSIIAMTDAAGTVTSRPQYDAWGNLEQGADQPGYAFTGREWDPETQLYYYRARYYDPKIGRFISEDPIGFGGGVNFYAYVANAPTTASDPLGLIRFWSREGSPLSQRDFDAVYNAVQQLRATLSPSVREFFESVYHANLDDLLSPGAGPSVELYSCSDGAEGESKNGKTRLNLSELRDPRLLAATLLHELAEGLDDATWSPGKYPNASDALTSASKGQAVAQSKGQFFHGLNPFLAEYYQYGHYLTYGGERK